MWTVTPDKYRHSKCYDHIARSFSEALGWKETTQMPTTEQEVLVFGPHLLPAINDIWPKNMILFNSEQLSREFFTKHPEYFRILESGQYRVWDYSRLNIEELERNGVGASLCEIGWMPSMSKLMANWFKKEKPQDIDVLFYGSTNDRRNKILKPLSEYCKLHVAYNVYGEELDKLIEKSKIVINIHHYDTAIHEIFRTSYLMANRKFVISERGRDKNLEKKYEGGIWFCDYNNLVSECVRMLRDKRTRDDVAYKGNKIFSKVRQDKILRGVV